MSLSGTMKDSLGEEAFRSVLSEWAQGPISDMHGVFSNRDYVPFLRGN